MQKIDEVVRFEDVEDGMAFVPVSPSSTVPKGEAYIKSEDLGRDDRLGYALVAHQHPDKDDVFISQAFTCGPFRGKMVRIVGHKLGHKA